MNWSALGVGCDHVNAERSQMDIRYLRGRSTLVGDWPRQLIVKRPLMLNPLNKDMFGCHVYAVSAEVEGNCCASVPPTSFHASH
jgi:hypothetical protein